MKRIIIAHVILINTSLKIIFPIFCMIFSSIILQKMMKVSFLKKRGKLLGILIGLCLSSSTVSSQTYLSDIQVKRVAKTCELWGHLKYFHPYLADDSIDWEKAFTENIDEVISATNSKEYMLALNNMLSYLNDPVTRIKDETSNHTFDGDGKTYPIVELNKDSILIFKFFNHNSTSDFTLIWEKIQEIIAKSEDSKAVFFDIRNKSNRTNVEFSLDYLFTFFKNRLSNENYVIPPLVSRYHDGFVAEGGGSPEYGSGFYEKGEEFVKSSPKGIKVPIVLIVDQHTNIPKVFIGLQKAGRVKIVSNQPIADNQISEHVKMGMEDSLTASLRTNVLKEGTSLKTDLIFSQNLNDNEVYEMISRFILDDKWPEPALTLSKSTVETSVRMKNKDTDQQGFYPDKEHRLLAVAKIYTIINYFFAYRELMDSDWNEVMHSFIPTVYAARDSVEYHLAIAEMYTHIGDGHGYTNSRILQQHFGVAVPPIQIRFIEDSPIITHIERDSINDGLDLSLGDELIEIDETSVKGRFDYLLKYAVGSNMAFKKLYVSNRLLAGEPDSKVTLKIRKANGTIITADLYRRSNLYRYISFLNPERQNKEIFYHLEENIGYVDLKRLTPSMVDSMFESFSETSAIVMDMRGYPLGTAWDIAPRLSKEKKIVAAKFVRYSPHHYLNLGPYPIKTTTQFDQFIPQINKPKYEGETVMLIDSRAVSQSEHSGLFFRAANGTKFIGSQTAGANGDVTSFQVPGKIYLIFSGQQVLFPDGTQLQKIGLVPDIEVNPTIQGIRAGRDEILESAVKYLSDRQN